MQVYPEKYEASQSAPAKVNLTLSVHGPREDGFHELSSLICALEFGDELSIAVCNGADRLECSDPGVPLGPENLILQAAEAFRRRTGLNTRYAFRLEKRIPMGAGLGGGSSDAVAALKLMNTLAEYPLTHEDLLTLSAELGSDCPFFVGAHPAIMRGRGERVEDLNEALSARIRGQRLVLFQPEYSINTAWAYQRLREKGAECYESVARSAERVRILEGGSALSGLLFNSFESIVGAKYLSMNILLNGLRSIGIPCLMSGSGSCCFALLDSNDATTKQIRGFVEAAWGKSVFWVETSIC
jgi:4-diphosphocytidyl-2-C-methyl-D-erythritol kinase